MEASVKK